MIINNCSGLSFIGYVGIGKFLPFFLNVHFSIFTAKKCSLKANVSHNKFFLFWRKQIMSINQAYDRLYSDKVSKFWFLGRFPTLPDPYSQRLLNGYQFLSQPSLSNAGGAALYINNNLNFSIRPEFTATTDNFEVHNNCHSNVLCGILYRHPNGDLGQFIDYLSCAIDRINQENKTCIIMGDFNIDLLKTRITFSNW